MLQRSDTLHEGSWLAPSDSSCAVSWLVKSVHRCARSDKWMSWLGHYPSGTAYLFHVWSGCLTGSPYWPHCQVDSELSSPVVHVTPCTMLYLIGTTHHVYLLPFWASSSCKDSCSCQARTTFACLTRNSRPCRQATIDSAPISAPFTVW